MPNLYSGSAILHFSIKSDKSNPIETNWWLSLSLSTNLLLNFQLRTAVVASFISSNYMSSVGKYLQIF